VQTCALPIWASVTSELSFQDCRIPDENRLPGAAGLKAPLACLSQARYGIAWGAVGAAMACYDWALQYAQQRVQFGKPIGGFQLVQRKLVWMLTEITKAQLLCLQLGRLKDQGVVRAQQISMAKMNNVARALKTARLARDILLIEERRGKRHLVILHPGRAFHSDRGFIGHDALIGALEGSTVKTSLGARYLALRPTLAEYVLEMPRGAQVIYPKDLATICHF